MSIVDAVNRMQQIESQIVALSGVTDDTASSGISRGSGSSATSFASSLTAASGSTVTAQSGQLVDNGVTGSEVVSDAQKYLGVPYVFGGTTASGLDCSGLVQRVYADLGIKMPRLVSGQSQMGVAVPSLADAQPGDLIETNGGDHIVIYAGNGMVIHAPHPGENVQEVKNWMNPSDIVAIRRIVPTQAQEAEAQTQTQTASASDQLTALESLMGGSGSSTSTDSLLFSLLSGSSSGGVSSGASAGVSSALSGALSSALSGALSGALSSASSGASSTNDSSTSTDALLASLLGGTGSATSSDSLLSGLLGGGLS